MKKYIVVGLGPAGAQAAEQLRALDKQAGITVFNSEPYPYYYRPKLSHYLGEQEPLERFILRDSAYYAQQNISLCLNTTITSLDPQNRLAIDQQGRPSQYDELLLATGASPFIPPLPGREQTGVFALRTFAQAQAITAYAQGSSNIAIVGGGLLGLEAGYGLIKSGHRVLVLETGDRLLPRQTDRPGAYFLQSRLAQMGLRFQLGGPALQAVEGQQRVTGLALADGSRLACDMVLFSTGVRPNLDLARQAGLAVDRGIIVNDHMQTSISGIWAAGDVSQHREVVYGFFPAALEQGRVAGRNMAGEKQAYEGSQPAAELKIAGIFFCCGGNPDPDGKCGSAVYQDDDMYRKLVWDSQGRLQGYLFIGSKDGLAQCRKALAAATPVGQWAQELERRDFDFSKLLA